MSRPVLPMSASAAGLCATCEHLRVQASKTSVFVRCGLAEVDSRFPKYPPLPVMVCGGYRKAPD
ncbi:MAG TPA: hypothetical protein VGS07_04700 [Thermoanaerobaculia bacterium]|nr:hypothetical protein [Thermoanaerobaculia bacterium]